MVTSSGPMKILQKKRPYHLIILFVITFVVLPYVTAHWNPYEILGIRRDASLEQIKKAYRELARKLHPDKSNLRENEAGKKFIELNKAFSLLKDPRKRRRYDQYGDIGEPQRTPPHLSSRIMKRMIEYTEYLVYSIGSSDPYITLVLMTVLAMVASLFYYSYQSSPTLRAPKEHMKTDPNISYHDPHFKSQTRHPESNELKILELKAETYNGMVRLLKPGHRTIVLLCDRKTKDILLPKFRKAIWIYRLNKTLIFGYLCLDKNLAWYRTLLQQITGLDELKVNKKNCIGTVLALYGFKNYFRVYHAKHNQPVDKCHNDGDSEGAFLGFDESNSSDDIENALEYNRSVHETKYTIESSLDGLPIWLDRMFDGSAKRYQLDGWPDEIE